MIIGEFLHFAKYGQILTEIEPNQLYLGTELRNLRIPTLKQRLS